MVLLKGVKAKEEGHKKEGVQGLGRTGKGLGGREGGNMTAKGRVIFLIKDAVGSLIVNQWM